MGFKVFVHNQRTFTSARPHEALVKGLGRRVSGFRVVWLGVSGSSGASALSSANLWGPRSWLWGAAKWVALFFSG